MRLACNIANVAIELYITVLHAKKSYKWREASVDGLSSFTKELRKL